VIDLIIAILRGAKNLKDAKACLMNGDISHIQFRHPGFEEDAKQLRFTEKQAGAILEMRLYKLIGLEILALQKDYKECLRRIAEYQKILENRTNMNQVIQKDLESIKKEFAKPRLTQIEDGKEAVYEEAPMEVHEVIFVMDKFGYCKTLDKSTYERNKEAVDGDFRYVVPCMNTDKLCVFTQKGNLNQIKLVDIPFGKLRDKGTPLDNLSKFDGSKENIIRMSSQEAMAGQKLLFATKMALVKMVPTEEFVTNNRTVASTKLTEGDELILVRPVGEETEVALQTSDGVFLKFPMEEIPEMKKNSRGVRGMKLAENEYLEQVYFVGEEPVISYKKKEVHLNRMKLGKRDGKGSKVRN